MLPAPLGAGSERVFQIGELQRLDELALQSMVQLLVRCSMRPRMLAADILPPPLVFGSERVFQIGELQRLDSWRSIYGAAFGAVFDAAPDARADILPPAIGLRLGARGAGIRSKQDAAIDDLGIFHHSHPAVNSLVPGDGQCFRAGKRPSANNRPRRAGIRLSLGQPATSPPTSGR